MKSDATAERLADRHVVLLGVGHTNAHVVRMWGMNPIPNAELTCVSDRSIATYSGRLPAVLAGQIPREQMEIDLVRLCASVGARLITDPVTGLDLPHQLVEFENRPPVPYDVLSVGIGSVPTVRGVSITGSTLLKIKPMQTFLQRLEESVARASERASLADRPVRIVVAGSGVAGIEITFCLPGFLKSRVDRWAIRVVTRSDEILPGVIPSMRQRAEEELEQRGVIVDVGRRVVGVSDEGVQLNNGEILEADLVIWATGASPPPLLSELGLPLDSRGFLATDSTLRSTSSRPIFAVGDSGTIVSEKLPKAGVYAVRQGPVLWRNLRALLDGEPLEKYQPQRSFLKLLNTGDGRAIGEWKGFSFGGSWVMSLKEHIDGKFMRMYQIADSSMAAFETMQCRGCGCKLGSNVLENALTKLGTTKPDTTKLDTTKPGTSLLVATAELDDAAIVETKAGRIIASTDFFTAPFSDAYLSGRVAALHSASDIIAMGANIKAALANVVVPEGSELNQQRVLSDLLRGAKEEFAAMDADVVGGHTIVGPRTEIGFTVFGAAAEDEVLLQKKNLKPGDELLLTKPLGIGALLAAHMRAQLKARHFDELIAAMLQRQHATARILIEAGVTAGTDITGFGLAGHLIEMLRASQVGASLNLDAIPLLPGAADMFSNNIESTLAPQNRNAESLITVSNEDRSCPEYKALFDPQTCGGLLLGIAPDTRSDLAARLSDVGITAFVIGQITAEDIARIAIS